MTRVLVTGAAGFIGMHVCLALLQRGDQVVGIDNLNDYYDVGLKRLRLSELDVMPGFRFNCVDVSDVSSVNRLFADHPCDLVVHLAAQAGVRYSLTNAQAYGSANLVGFLNILEACRHGRVGHLVYASSSSVYGGNRKMPFAEQDTVDHPVSLYAATKKANELMAHSYSHLYGLPTTGLRFFTAYGPWGRPDMAYFKFADAIMADQAIPVFNHGQMSRDFTYIDDIVNSLLAVLDRPPTSPEAPDATDEPAGTLAPYRVLNIGSHHPVSLLDFIGILERALGRGARLELLPMQPGDVPATYADVSCLQRVTGMAGPVVTLEAGIARFADWYRSYRRSVPLAAKSPDFPFDGS